MTTVSQTGSRPGALEAMIHRSNDVGELLREDDSLLRQQFFAILREHHPKVSGCPGPYSQLEGEKTLCVKLLN